MSRSCLPWLSLGLVLTLFLAYLASIRPAGYFGRYHDDTIYFASAQALAQGRGYTVPSLPGSPPQTKYPVLYPWLLSWIWRWQPSFPANVGTAVGMTALFACAFLAAAFVMLRRMEGLGEWTAPVIVALCAFQPHFLFLSGAVLSDVPFMALALWAAVLADRALRSGQAAGLPYAALAGALAGLSVLSRGFGLAVVAGIAAAGLYRRAFRQVAILTLVAAPFVAFASLSRAPLADPRGPEGFRQTWLFYTSYGEFWKLSVPRLDVFRALLADNIRAFLEGPATYCLFPPLGGDESYLGMLLGSALTVGILAGIVRQARRQEWKPIHFIFLFYTGLTLLWNYPLMDRFLMLFLPLFYAGLWVEGRHFAALLRANLRPSRPLAEKALAAMLGVVAGAGLLRAAGHYLRGYRPQLFTMVARRTALGAEKQQAYEWIRGHTGPGVRFVAYEDVSLYLYTGRQAMRPIAFSTEAFYKKDEKALERDLDHITDVARHIGARYWVMAEDDFHMETGLPLIEKRLGEWKTRLPAVFRSSGNKVAIYDLSL
ncbi:MAG: hypothetical protein HY238_20985 [Acidobacteria bacterium]|nr:hypothetical protein [Acidobacteriota bacterium]